MKTAPPFQTERFYYALRGAVRNELLRGLPRVVLSLIPANHVVDADALEGVAQHGHVFLGVQHAHLEQRIVLGDGAVDSRDLVIDLRGIGLPGRRSESRNPPLKHAADSF